MLFTSTVKAMSELLTTTFTVTLHFIFSVVFCIEAYDEDTIDLTFLFCKLVFYNLNLRKTSLDSDQ